MANQESFQVTNLAMEVEGEFLRIVKQRYQNDTGVTKEEIAETVFIASAIRAGGAVGNGLLAMRIFDEV